MPERTPTENIQQQMRAYAEARAALAERIEEVDAARRKLVRQHLRFVRAAIAKAKSAEEALLDLVAENPALFARPNPRSMSEEGVKVGFQKSKTRVEFSSAAELMERIESEFPEQLAALVRVKREPVRAALAALSDEQLQKLGARRVGGEDQAYVSAVATELEHMVTRLLDGMDDEQD